MSQVFVSSFLFNLYQERKHPSTRISGFIDEMPFSQFDCLTSQNSLCFPFVTGIIEF